MITAEQAQTLAKASEAASKASDGGTPQLDGYTALDTPELNDPDTGLSLTIFRKDGTNEYIVAFAGTGDTQDAAADLALGTPQWTKNSAEVLNYLATELENPTSIDFTGRSLGGALAQYAAYDYLKANENNSERADVSLTTYNGLGGTSGLEQMYGESFDSSLASGLDAAHFYTKSGNQSDIVSRLGGEHFGGNTYEIPMAETNEGFIDTHIAWKYFNELTTIPDAKSIDYLDVPGAQQLAALFAFAGDDGKFDKTEGFFRTAGGLLLGASMATSNEFDQLVDALCADIAFTDWGMVRDSMPIGMRLAVAVLGMESVVAGNGAQLIGHAWDLTTEQIKATVGLMEEAVKIGEYALREAIDAGSEMIVAASDIYMESLNYAADRVVDLVDMFDQAIDYTADKWREMQNLSNQVGEWLQGQIINVGQIAADTTIQLGSWVTKLLMDGPIMMGNIILNAIKSLRSIFNAGENTGLQSSPIILDLDKDGVETTALTSGTYFDHDANGFSEQTGWASSDDGLLVIDRDNDGLIEDGTELFGDNTLLSNGTNASNGFQALAELDTNTDGKIDSTDAAYSQLRVWQDIDEDGYTSEGELKTLDELGIQSINTGYTNSTEVDANGNEHKQISTFTWNDGTTNEATDVWFKQDKMYTIANDWVEVPDDIAALPDLQGFGNVYDLHQAMARERQEAIGTGQEERLKALIEQFAAATDVTTRNSLIDQIIYRWTGVEGIDPTSRGPQIDARKLEALEELFGEEFVGTTGSDPHWRAKPCIEASYKGLTELVYSQLMAQTHLKDLFSTITYTWDEATQSIKANMSAAIAAIQTELTANPEAGQILLGELSRTIRGMGAEEMLNYQNFKEVFVSQDPSLEWTIESTGRNIITGTNTNDSIVGAITNDAITTGDGNDAISASDGNDVIYGGAGNDGIDAGRGDDLLDGGPGNDTMNGATGNDTYKFGIGYGSDAITDYGTISDSGEENIDTVQFGPGITANDLEFIKESGNLRIKLLNTTDTLLIYDWFAGATYRIEQFKFTDGTVLTPADIDTIGYKMYGTTAIDSLSGSTVNDEIKGYEGNDNLYGYAGNDLLDGGTGNDYMNGGEGNDTYIYNLGNGSDTIYDYAADYATATDTIQFGEGITANDLEFVKQASDLKIKINGTSDVLTITSWFYTPAGAYRIENFKFADGIALTSTEIDAAGYKVYGTSANESLEGSTANDTIYGYEGNDTIQSWAGNDTLIGAQGDDRLYSGAGSDTIDGGIGNDYIVGDSGNDTFIYRLGDGTDTIIDFDMLPENCDTIQFGPGINKNDLEYTKEGDNLRIKLANTTETLLLQSWFNNTHPEYYRIEKLKFADGQELTPADIDAAGYKMYGTAGNDVLYASNMNDQINGYEGNDVISSYNGDDILIGAAGNDNLTGGAGQDIIDGGIGNDTLYGGQGNDTYIYRFGDGSDTISDTDSTAGNIDTIQFGEGINSSNIEWIKEGGHLRVKFTNTSDTILIQNWFSGANYKIERFLFTDGTTLTSADIDAAGFKMYGTTANDSLQGTSANDVIYGNEGNDYLYGYAGADTLDGGVGNDTLTGDIGNDTYKFAIGYGQDTINDYEAATNTDKVEFGPGIASTDLEYIKEGNNMKIKIIGQTDTLIIQNWFNGTNPNAPYRIEQLKFADGTTITPANIDAIGYKMYGTTGNEYLTGSNVNDTIYGNAGNDTLYGQAGNDTLNGEAGTDNLQGEAGNDTLDGGTGNDTLNGGLGNDTYKFETGSGADTINDYSTDYATTTDKVEMGINSLNTIFTKTGNNLILTNNTNTDQITIQNWYTDQAYQTEEIKTGDNKCLLNTQVAQLIQAMATFCTNNGVTWNQAIEQKPAEVQQVLAQYWSQT